MLWALLAIISGFCDATIFAILKRLKSVDKTLLIWTQHVFSIPFLFIILYFFMPKSINGFVYPLAAVNSIILIITLRLLIRAFQSANLSLTIPLLSLTPLFLLVTSWVMLGETPNSFLGYGGIMLIVVGTYVLNFSNKGILGPFIVIYSNVGCRSALGAAFLMSIMGNMFKIGILNSNAIYYILLINLMISLFLLPYIIKKIKKTMVQIKNNLKDVFILGVAKLVMEVTAGIALTFAIVPFVISLKRSSVLFGMAYSYFLFKEKHIQGRLLGAVVMLAGAIMIIIS